MKITGKQSVASLLYYVISITLYALGALIILFILLLGIIRFESLPFEFDYSASIPGGTETSETMIGNSVYQSETTVMKIDMKALSENDRGSFTVIHLLMTGMLFYVGFGLFLLLIFLRDVKHEIIFSEKNFNRLRGVSLIILFADPVWQLVRLIAQFTVFSGLSHGTSYTISIPGNFTLIISGALLLVISEIFRQAYYIKKEQDLTV